MYSTLFILRDSGRSMLRDSGRSILRDSGKQIASRQFTTSISSQHGQIQRLHLQLIGELQRQDQDKIIRDLAVRVEKLEKTMLELHAPKVPVPYVKREMSVLVIPDIFLEIPKG